MAEVISILEISRSGYRSETLEVMTGRGKVTVENLTPGETDMQTLRAAENKLYDIFSKYRKEPVKKRQNPCPPVS